MPWTHWHESLGFALTNLSAMDNIKDTLFVAENEEMSLEKTYSIDELTGTALEKALAETKEAEFDNEDVDRQTLIDYNRMTGCRCNDLGEFISHRS